MPVQRTPVFVLTNNFVNFMSDIAFRERIVIYNFKKPDWLEKFTKKPYTLAIYTLLNKYNVTY